MRALSITLVLALWACGGSDDEDGDGFGLPQDCNDRDENIYPGNAESCDGLDNDCDGAVDEDLGEAFYEDADHDGFGTGDANRTCDSSTGVAAVGGDCDDTNPDVHPEAAEDCGTADLNCDGDPVAGAADLFTWYLDADLDTFGSDTTGQASCEPIAGRVTTGGDCNDTNNTVHPGADEVCDGQDNDCDPATLEDDSAEATTWYPDTDLDGHGVPQGSVTACEAPGADWSDVDDDCAENDGSIYPGANELCDGGVDNDCDPTTDEATTAHWYRDQDGDLYGSDLPADEYIGCSPPGAPGDYVQVAGDCDDTEPGVNPVATPGCTWDHCSVNSGQITTSQTWRSNVTHYADCTISVEGLAQPILTIEDGTRVEFGPNGALSVGDGSPGNLVIQGAVSGVTLTSVDPIPSAGDWKGLKLGNGTTAASVISGLTVEFGGGNGFGGVWVDGSDVEISGLTARENLGDGLRVSGDNAEPYIHDSELSYNTGNGLTVALLAGLRRSPAGGGNGPTFTDNVVSYNGGRPISIPGSHADEIDPSSVLTDNAVPEIELIAGTLKFTGTWFDHGIPYTVAQLATIRVEDGPQALLTIEDGATVQFNIDADLRVGEFAEGALVIQDGPAGVVFTATPEVVQLSDNWDGIYLGTDADNSLIRNALVEYGGGDGLGSLVVYDSAPTITDVLVRRSDTNGIYVYGSSAAPLIQNSVILDNDVNGVEINSGGIARSAGGPTFANNQLRGNGQSPVVVPPNFVGELDPSTQFSGNGDRIAVKGGTVTETAVWRKLDEDYEIRGTVEVGGPQNPVVLVEDENVLYFDRGTRLRVGMLDDGALVVPGGLGVVMTSADTAPGRGDWYGVEIGRNGAPGSGNQQSELHDLRVEYAGNTLAVLDGAVSILDREGCTTQEPQVIITDLEIYESSRTGLAVQQSATVTVDGLTIDGAADGCVNVGGANPAPTCHARITQFDNFSCVNSTSFGTWPIEHTDLLQSVVVPGPVSFRDSSMIADETLFDLGVPYIVHRDLTIGNVSVPVLTIERDVEVQFMPGAGLIVATGGTNGGIDIRSGALLTSANAVPAAGDWDGITFNTYCTPPVSIQGATIEFAGQNGAAALYFNTCALTAGITGNTITDSSACGVYLNPRTIPAPIGNTFQRINGGNICLAP